MMRAQPIIDRLNAKGFPYVFGVLEWAGLRGAPAYSPALYVIPAQESAKPNEMNGIHDQRVNTMFRVAILLKPNAIAQGKASDELEKVERQVIDALAGWKHPDATGGCDYAGGRLLSADGPPVAWGSDFMAAWRLRKGIS